MRSNIEKDSAQGLSFRQLEHEISLLFEVFFRVEHHFVCLRVLGTNWKPAVSTPSLV